MIKTVLNKFAKEEDGATAIEYGLMAALIGVAIIGAVRAIGTGLDTQFNAIASSVETNPSSITP